MTQHTFRQEEIEQLRDYRDKQRDGRLKIRFVGLLMLVEGIAIEQATPSSAEASKC